jgi:hypothetical protein
MAASKPPRKSDDVPHADLLDEDDLDANLLDEEEPDTVVVHTTYDYTFAQTPKSTGKNLKINSPHPVDMPKTPPATPPRPGASAESGTSKDTTGKVNVPSGRHYTKLGIYLHTDRRPTLTRILTTHFPCNPRFFTKTRDLDSIVEKAKFLLMNQEPYHTLLQEGCSVTFIKPQLSYKVVAIEENDLIDFVTDLKNCPSHEHNPVPFYEFSDDSNFTQTDVSFLFRVQPKPHSRKPEMKEQTCETSDIATLTPLIDAIRNAAPALQAATRHTTPTPTTTPRPALSLANTAPPRHNITPAPTSPERVARPRPHDRLGPPVPHVFRDRSRSHDRNRRSREFRRRK